MSNLDTTTIEQKIICTVTDYPDSFDAVAEIVSVSDFSIKRHQTIWAAIQELVLLRRSFDIVGVMEHLKHTGNYDAVGGDYYFDYLIKNNSSTTSGVNIAAYAKRIKEFSVLRTLKQAAEKINELIDNHNGKPLEDLISEADSIFSEATMLSANDIEIFDGKVLGQSVLKEFLLTAKSGGGIQGISTGIPTIDEQTDGLQRGEVIVIAAPPSMGKTTFAVNLVQNALRTTRLPVVVFSMEMPAKDIFRRMWSTESLVNYSEIKRGTAKGYDTDKMTTAHGKLSNPLLKIVSKSPMTPSGIRSVLKRLSREYGGIQMAMVDYIQLMECDKKCGNRNEELTIISREIKRMAMEFNMPFIVLSQLTKTVETQKRKPTNGDLRESGAIAQDADMIMMVHRQEKYDENDIEWQGKAEIIVTKSRNGKTGTSLIGFDGSTFRFYELNNHWSKI